MNQPNAAPLRLEHAPLFERLLSQMADYAVVLLDPTGRVLAWRGAARELFGYSEGDMQGRMIDELFTAEDRALGLPAHERAIAQADGRAEDDRWHLRKDGTRIWVIGSVTALRGDQGELLGYGKLMRDRTDVRIQIETLENRADELARAHREKDLFFARLAHEVRNSLAPLRNATELISRAADPSQLAFPLALVQRQLELLGRMARDLTEMARIGSGQLELALQPLNLQLWLEPLLIGLRARAASKHQNIQVLLPSGTVLLEADPERLHQIVFNLVDNAIKYTPQGGRIWVKALVEGPDAVIRVEDTGDGIAPDMLPRIFDLFTQGASSQAQGGLGVGLAVVKDLVHAHGGTVEVRSAGVNHGSEFTVRLPLHRER